MVSLIERAPVRSAAVALIKVLLREAGLRVSDLVPPPEAKGEQAGVAAPVLHASRQLVTPAPAKPPRVHKPPAWGIERAAPIPGVVAPKIGLKGGGEVVVPPDVKVTQCPSGRDTRYTVEGPVVGEFTREWQARRGGKC
jgi:hypothetical protein